MAGNGDIRQKIVLEGEKEYSSALKEAQRNLKVLRSELKLETAELGKNATEQQKNETRTRNLQKQIKEQEKVVRTYEKALEEVRARYGDNEEAIAKWETKLNDAKTALANMRNDLDDTADSMGQIGKAARSSGDMGVVAMNSLAESMQRVGEIGGSISDGLESAFTGVIGIISSAITDLWADVMEIAGKANGWTDLAAMFGASTNEIQQWENTLKAAGKDFSVLGGLMTRLARGKTDNGIAEWLGISSENYENELEYTLLIMQRLHEEQGKMSASSFNKMLTENFRGSENDIRWFLANYDYLMEKQEKYDAEGGGFGLSDEQIEKMNELYLRVQDIKTSWEALKSMAMVELFGDLSLQITGNIQNIVDAFKEYFDAEDDAGREAALQKVRENIEKMFKAIKEAIQKGIEALGKLAEELQKSEDPAVRAFGNMLEKIVSVLEWFADENNWETVKRGFEALIGVWAIGKIAKAVGNITAFATSVKTIMGGSKSLFGAAAGLGETGSTAGGLIGAGMGNALWAATPLAVFVASMAPAVIQQLHNEENWKEEQEHLEEAGEEAIQKGDVANGQFIRKAAQTTGPEKYADGTYKVGLGGLIVRPTDEQHGQLMSLQSRSGKQYAELMAALMMYGGSTKGNSTYLALQDYWKSGGEGYDSGDVTLLIENIAYALEQYSNSKMNESDYQKTNGGSGYNRRLPNGWVYKGGNIYNTETGKYLNIGGAGGEGLWGAWDENTYYEWYKSQNLNWNQTHSGIPADAWNNGGEGGVKTELSAGSTAAIGTAVKGAVSGIKVVMDGVTVGHLVAPTVSQDIARETAVP